MREYFSQFGKVVDSTVMLDRETGRSKGFGFVSIENTNIEPLLGFGKLEIDGKMVLTALLNFFLSIILIAVSRSMSNSLSHVMLVMAEALRVALTGRGAIATDKQAVPTLTLVLLHIQLPPLRARRKPKAVPHSTPKLWRHYILACSSNLAVPLVWEWAVLAWVWEG